MLLELMLLAQAPDFEPLFRQALEQRERTLGAQAPKTRESARDLGLYLAGRGEFVKAAPYLDFALTTTAPEAATVLHNWAVALEADEPAVAERLYRRALEIRTKHLPAMDVELAATRLNLAGLLLARGEAEAGRLAGAALVAFEKQWGAMDARVGVASGMLGAIRATEGNVAAAEPLFRRALAIAEKAHGPEAAETASALENLADLLAQTGRESAAGPLVQRAQRIRTRAR